jgi:hypothetical protein
LGRRLSDCEIARGGINLGDEASQFSTLGIHRSNDTNDGEAAERAAFHGNALAFGIEAYNPFWLWHWGIWRREQVRLLMGWHFPK